MSGLDLLIPQSSLWYMLLVATVAGAILGVLCDGLFILRLLLRDPTASVNRVPIKMNSCCTGESIGGSCKVLYAILQAVCDFASALLATVILLLLCYYTSDGQLRALAVFGIIAGFWIYRRTVSALARRLIAALLDRICCLLRFVWSHTLGRLLSLLLGRVIRQARNAATDHRIVELSRDAEQGFGLSENIPEGK